jgi:hypothetical protein
MARYSVRSLKTLGTGGPYRILDEWSGSYVTKAITRKSAARTLAKRWNKESREAGKGIRNPSASQIVGIALTPAKKFLGFIDGLGRIRKGSVKRVKNPTPKGYSDAGISGYGKAELKQHIRVFREQGYLVRIQWVGGKWYLYTKRKR